ncbi:wax ester/triacylglycerol synthase domain-containing protein [Mycolicibacterium grossiae]|uniref:wax ester/triacylglycerol synthase domain-containing protein n=1 Tax=Mycolicibacterium grossiae TaxID=1552759 RepID=UPI000A6C4CF6|nr:wax ester/triacylglycerol synthase domain-containing protein [Mycolicibacterium grossiae]
MRQLSSLDTQFLAIEDGRRTGHVGALAVYDPRTAPDGVMDCGTMTALLEQRLHILPPLRWRLLEMPLRLDYPYWVDDDDFDLSYHVRESALPSPGDDEQLSELVSRLHGRALDRSRPLWEMYVISGLAGGLVAVYTKIHHAVIDGVSGAEITGLLMDVDPEGREFHRPNRSPRTIRPVKSSAGSAPSSGCPAIPPGCCERRRTPCPTSRTRRCPRFRA